MILSTSLAFHFFIPETSSPSDGQGPGGVWCDVDVVEFAYFGAPASTPKEQLYTELADGLRGGDPTIASGSQVLFPLPYSDQASLLSLLCSFKCSYMSSD